jgi:hypothetical protein
MYSIEPFELGIACIVFTLYISGKVWMYYNHNDRDTKKPKKGLIKRGPEWPE